MITFEMTADRFVILMDGIERFDYVLFWKEQVLPGMWFSFVELEKLFLSIKDLN